LATEKNSKQQARSERDPKEIPMTKHQNSARELLSDLELGASLDVGAWNLEL
jgi:hypothetical protein